MTDRPLSELGEDLASQSIDGILLMYPALRTADDKIVDLTMTTILRQLPAAVKSYLADAAKCPAMKDMFFNAAVVELVRKAATVYDYLSESDEEEDLDDQLEPGPTGV